MQILIEGHCDERGTSAYNLALGDRRANAAKEYLVSLGIDASRVRTISYGKERPFCTESTESCWQENRRAHLVITAK
jgi:peptidoglycan-associated lipoprotein